MLTLVTGGSGSGKSAFAEDRVLSFGEAQRYYIATMYCFDEESKKRIQRHRMMRKGKGFDTIERYTDLKNLEISKGSVILLECMSNLVANEMFQEQGAKEHTVQAVLEGVKAIKERTEHFVIVTNEIFSEAASYEGETKIYQKYLGEINQGIASMADEVVEVVYGIPIFHKGVKNEKLME